MAIDFEMTPRQRKLKDDAREFAREVLRPVTERADAIADPQEAFVAMKPAFEAANALGFATSFLPAEYGGGGASMADPGFTPDLFVDCEPFDFKKSMEGFGVGVEIR
jgi:nitroalkane oxidase